MSKELTRPMAYGELGFHVMGDNEVLTHDYMSLPVETSDPTDPVKGQVWINVTTSELKVCIDDVGTIKVVSLS